MNPTLSLPTLPLSVFFNSYVMSGILVVFLFFYVIVGMVLFYHWSAYGMRSHGILIAETLFSFISVVLFVIASLAIHYY